MGSSEEKVKVVSSGVKLNLRIKDEGARLAILKKSQSES